MQNSKGIRLMVSPLQRDQAEDEDPRHYPRRPMVGARLDFGRMVFHTVCLRNRSAGLLRRLKEPIDFFHGARAARPIGGVDYRLHISRMLDVRHVRHGNTLLNALDEIRGKLVETKLL